MNKVAILVPVYKETMTDTEKLSFEQLFCVLSRYKIYLFAPKSLNLDGYKKLAVHHNQSFSVEYFEPDYFKNIDGYNRLLLSRGFYKRFIKFNFILIYQLDAYVFRDELEEWCDKDFDYIGAPIMSEEKEGAIIFKKHSGNGGLSLRKPKVFYNILNSKKPFYSFSELIKQYRANFNRASFVVRLPLLLFRSMGWKNNISYMLNDFGRNEDAFWFEKAPELNKNYKVAPFHQARKFAFEKKPEYLYKLNDGRLPFGCHAFEKHDVGFWKGFIKF